MSLQPDQDSTWRVRHVAGRPTGAATRPVVTAAGQLIDDAMRAFGVLVTAAGGHSRFGRGRGKGTARRSTTMVCMGWGGSWVEGGAGETTPSKESVAAPGLPRDHKEEGPF